ncbi:MAG: hypothetical protein ACI86M_001225 [Saprospiraceae bacterium]|jgi:hypothetical protein
MKKLIILCCLWIGTQALFSQQSSTINIFSPDPMTTLGVTYSQGDDNFNNLFQGQYQQVDINYNSITTNTIEGSRVNIVDFEDPKITGLNVISQVTRDDHRFKAFNTYYHADQLIQHYNSLGFSFDVIDVDPYAETGDNGHMITMGSSNNITGVKLVQHYNEPNPNSESVDMAEDAFGIANAVSDLLMTISLDESSNTVVT